MATDGPNIFYLGRTQHCTNSATVS